MLLHSHWIIGRTNMAKEKSWHDLEMMLQNPYWNTGLFEHLQCVPGHNCTQKNIQIIVTRLFFHIGYFMMWHSTGLNFGAAAVFFVYASSEHYIFEVQYFLPLLCQWSSFIFLWAKIKHVLWTKHMNAIPTISSGSLLTFSN